MCIQVAIAFYVDLYHYVQSLDESLLHTMHFPLMSKLYACMTLCVHMPNLKLLTHLIIRQSITNIN